MKYYKVHAIFVKDHLVCRGGRMYASVYIRPNVKFSNFCAFSIQIDMFPNSVGRDELRKIAEKRLFFGHCLFFEVPHFLKTNTADILKNI